MGWPGPLTHRQSLVWDEFYFWSKNEPTVDQMYLMQISADIIDIIPASFTQGYQRTDLNKRRIKFTRKVTLPLTEEQIAKQAHEHSMLVAGMFGFSPELIASLKPGESIQLGKGTLAREQGRQAPDPQLKRVKKGKGIKPNPRPDPNRGSQKGRQLP